MSNETNTRILESYLESLNPEEFEALRHFCVNEMLEQIFEGSNEKTI